MAYAKLSQKNQIVVPKEARQEMGVKAGDQLIVETLHGVTLLMPKPKKIGHHLRGHSKGLYSKNYLKNERASWPS